METLDLTRAHARMNDKTRRPRGGPMSATRRRQLADSVRRKVKVSVARQKRPHEPEHRRTMDPVHRGSRLVGGERRVIVAWKCVPGYKRALAEMSWRERTPGKRRGHGGTISLAYEKVLVALIEHAAAYKGDLFPSIATIAKWAGVGRTSVKKAIKLFVARGMLEYDRRHTYTDEQGPRGLRKKQASNFYRVLVSPLVAVLRTLLGKKKRVEAEAEAARQAVAKQLRIMAYGAEAEARRERARAAAESPATGVVRAVPSLGR